jgi:hypothetical protein
MARGAMIELVAFSSRSSTSGSGVTFTRSFTSAGFKVKSTVVAWPTRKRTSVLSADPKPFASIFTV